MNSIKLKGISVNNNGKVKFKKCLNEKWNDLFFLFVLLNLVNLNSNKFKRILGNKLYW